MNFHSESIPKIIAQVDNVCKLWARAGQSNSGYAYDPYAPYAVEEAKKQTESLRQTIRDEIERITKARNLLQEALDHIHAHHNECFCEDSSAGSIANHVDWENKLREKLKEANAVCDNWERQVKQWEADRDLWKTEADTLRAEVQRLKELAYLTDNDGDPSDTLWRDEADLWVKHATKVTNERDALRTELEQAKNKSDEEMLRVKACEHIAEGEEGWERVENLCPSTAAVASLRRELEQAKKDKERLVEALGPWAASQAMEAK